MLDEELELAELDEEDELLEELEELEELLDDELDSNDDICEFSFIYVLFTKFHSFLKI